MSVRASLPWRFAKWLVLQVTLVLLVVVMAIFMKNLLVAQVGGWFLFILFHLPNWYAFQQIGQAFNQMDYVKLSLWATRMPYILWGASGEFWRDVILAFVAYAHDKPVEADALLKPWQGIKDLPAKLKEVPIRYALLGRSVAWDWQGVISEFEKLRFEARKPDPTLYFAASRAYIELGRLDKSSECLRQARFDESLSSLEQLASGFLTFFTLCGDLSNYEKIAAIVRKTQKSYPPVLFLNWKGRCLHKAGRVDEAIALFEEALAKTDLELLSKRISFALELARWEKATGEKPKTGNFLFSLEDGLRESQEIFKLFQRGAFVQELLAPKRESLLVRGLVCLNIAFFLLANNVFPLLGPQTALMLFNWGLLDQRVFTLGEYYRLVSYLFLHASLLHLIFNLGGLYFVGRVAENVFGSVRFMAIYFVGGMLSGVAHLLLNPELPAVGASGAILAIFAACAGGIYRLKNVLPQSVRRRYLKLMACIAVLQLSLDQFVPHIAIFAHLGGLLFGLLLGFVTTTRDPLKEPNGEIEGTQTFVGS
jgi:rhomboid protease GluP